MERIPILKLGAALLVTIQVDMHDRLAIALEEDLTAKIASTAAKGVLIDECAMKESEAFTFIQRTAMSERTRMRDVADRILDGSLRPS